MEQGVANDGLLWWMMNLKNLRNFFHLIVYFAFLFDYNGDNLLCCKFNKILIGLHGLGVGCWKMWGDFCLWDST